ncbi:MAG TPA: hypothetical protein VFW50_35925 [Streptosporangiaceae bacterium]|nr:hypothetical protein [Streptosporangiaceae bacterium]
MVNIWNPYQCMVTFAMSRSVSLFESGISRGIGFRDSCQDLLGFVQLAPDRISGRVTQLEVDGRRIERTLVPLAPPGATVQVEAVVG